MNHFLTPIEAKQKIPLDTKSREQISNYRKAICNVLTAKDPRLLLIVGPCSIHNEEKAIEYAHLLSSLADNVKEQFLVVMRTYVEKPRTKNGWKGFLYDPDLDGSYDIESGILRTRKLLKALTAINIPLACEFLDPITSRYYSDYISWGSVGARTSQSPIHRQLAASLAMPIGFKNKTDGCIESAIDACYTSKAPHHFLGINEMGNVTKIMAPGNVLPHLVLRGGHNGPNYEKEAVIAAKEKMVSAGIHPAILVDCSHDNSRKNHRLQPNVFFSVLENLNTFGDALRGIMLESFLDEGSQNQYKKSAQEILKTVSFTDSCLDWQTTKECIEQAAKLLCQKELQKELQEELIECT